MKFSPDSSSALTHLAVKIMDKGAKEELFPDTRWTREELETLSNPNVFFSVVSYINTHYARNYSPSGITECLERVVNKAAELGITLEIPPNGKKLSPSYWQL